jgi:hypothetical protein
MESIIINFKNGKTETFPNIDSANIIGEYLIVVTKKTTSLITSESLEEEHFLMKTHEIFHLSDVNNFTRQIKTNKYGS